MGDFLSLDGLYKSAKDMINGRSNYGGGFGGASNKFDLPIETSDSLPFDEKMFIQDGVSNSTFRNDLITKLSNSQITHLNQIENDVIPLKRASFTPSDHVISIDDIDVGNLPNNFLDVLNKYDRNEVILENTVQFYKESADKDAGTKQVYMQTHAVQSIFNPYFGVKSRGFTSNKPLLDRVGITNNMFVDTSDCSIWALLKASLNNMSPGGLGLATYRLADFMYCKDLGKVSNNHLITLRRYAAPIGDNIFKAANTPDPEDMFSSPSDIGRLVTWFGTDDNKLSDILKMSFAASWKEMNAEIQEVQSEGAGDGIFGMIANSLNPAYNRAMGAGIAGGNDLTTLIGSKVMAGKNVNFGPPYKGNQALTNYDKHKIYEPKNTIQSNHYYEGKLTFNNEFTLNFSYKLRSYGSLNQKSVMLDLINNILRVTYTKGKFWGGDVKWIGPPGNNSLMKKMHAFVDNTFDKLAGWTESLLAGDINWQQMLGSLSDAIGAAKDKVEEATKDASGTASKAKDAVADHGQKALEYLKSKDLGESAKGFLKNMLGRPAMYAINSMVSGENLGLWHVTVGNPLNPIASMGNLIMTNAELSFGDTPLGLDDFPSELKVAVTLKHCKPRDMIGIGQIFTRGETGLAVPIGQSGWTTMHTGADPGRDKSGKGGLNSQNYFAPESLGTTSTTDRYLTELNDYQTEKQKAEAANKNAKPGQYTIPAVAQYQHTNICKAEYTEYLGRQQVLPGIIDGISVNAAETT